MALDESAMESARRGAVAVRLYSFEPDCISLGRNQPTVGQLNGRPSDRLVPGLDVVRRPTGGRAVFHGPEVTYAVAVPERLLGGPRATYRAIHAALAAALARLGVPLDARAAEGTEPGASAGGAAGRPRGRLDLEECFVAAAPGEITVGGRKLVGSAQWRHRGAILQHGSILLRNEQRRASVSGTGGGGAIGLGEILAVVPSRDEVAAVVAASLRELAEARADPSPPRAEDLAVAETRAARYRSPEWTWRR